MPGSGIMFVGEKGVQISAYYGGNPWMPFGREPAAGRQVRGLPGGWLLPESRFKDFKQPAHLPRCEKPDHYTEWVRMCKAGKKSITPIEFACGLTEFALLGTLAQRRYTMPAAPPREEAAAGGARPARGQGPGLGLEGHEIHQRRRGQQPGRHALPQGVGLQGVGVRSGRGMPRPYNHNGVV
jgi:hypothetical protein